ncbi:TOBE domain-containing protein [Polaromonas sp. UC242_47]|uniref:TOBE domain-containing protein n=1 Tax=Polaromonas sp. UC242_47 TaxID=3374626 RepID=UPI0037B93580
MKPAAPSFASAFSHEPADKRIEILRLVGDSGSISQAARQAKVSYKAAWQAIDTLTNLAGVALVERAVGGSGGGGATLTPAGQKLLAVAKLLSETRGQILAKFGANELLLPRALPVLSNMSVRTSMRNQLPCQVDKLERKGQIVRVHLRLAGDALLVSRITKASAELLGLQKGQSVLALCKATAVVVTPDTTAGLGGQALRISRGASGDEVSLQLDGGLQLVGFATAGSGIKTQTRVKALIDEAAVVIALAA